MKMKEILTEHQKLNRAIQYVEFAKDQLYDYVGENSDAIEKVQSYFPINDFLSQVAKNEGRIAHSNVLRIIKTLDEIIMKLVDGNKRAEEFKNNEKYIK
jgi:hypothetical protein